MCVTKHFYIHEHDEQTQVMNNHSLEVHTITCLFSFTTHAFIQMYFIDKTKSARARTIKK